VLERKRKRSDSAESLSESKKYRPTEEQVNKLEEDEKVADGGVVEKFESDSENYGTGR